jgi:FecR protein
MKSWERRASADRAVAHLVRLAQDAATGELSPVEQAGLFRLESELARAAAGTGAPRSTKKRWLGAGLAAAAAICVLVVGRAPKQPFEVANGSVSHGGYIRPSAAEGAQVRFADGTEVVLEPGARTKVAEVYAHGARVVIEEGKARLRVKPLREAKWLVEAGPYSIQVTGTIFDVAWAAPEESLDLWLREGSVIVTGPLTTGGFVVRAGQHLVARVRESQLLLDGRPSEDFRFGSSDSAVEGPPPETPGVPAPGAPRRHPPTDAPRGVGPAATAATLGAADDVRSPAWSKRLAAGDFEGILADATRRGMENVLSRGSRADLAALADAARYVRRFDVARRALLAERERFAGSVRGQDAAFFLGGLAESDAAPVPSALEWYERYLAENPRGTYASQALGRKLMILHRLRGREAVKPLALDYLNQFPKGPYARHARNLLETNAVK